MAIKNVTVVGSGTMGSQIALQTAYSGRYEISLTDADPQQLEKARAQNERLVQRAVEKGRLSEADGKAALDRLRMTPDLQEAVQAADLAIEAVFENVDVKQDIFKQLDACAPEHAILASNSSSIAISRLASVTRRPDRCVNMHFFHPVTVMELCEVVRGPETSEETVQAALEFVRSIGRVPVLLNKEIHGFIVNRILFAATEEALRLLEGGYASYEDIDTAVKKGLNWPLGIFELLDFSGLDVFYGVMQDRARVGEGSGPTRTLEAKVKAGELGRKTGKGFYNYSKG